jgi:hypothetical protein
MCLLNEICIRKSFSFKRGCRSFCFSFSKIEVLLMPFPKLTWVGLLIATLGWGFILSYPLIAPFMSGGGQMMGSSEPARFIPILGENAIMTGLAVALLGALEKALRLLGKIAANSGQQRQPQRSSAPLTAPAGPIASPPPAAPILMSQRAPHEVVTRGALNGREYVLFRDGSVVVETLLGARRFGSITEAQEFIGAN